MSKAYARTPRRAQLSIHIYQSVTLQDHDRSVSANETGTSVKNSTAPYIPPQNQLRSIAIVIFTMSYPTVDRVHIQKQWTPSRQEECVIFTFTKKIEPSWYMMNRWRQRPYICTRKLNHTHLLLLHQQLIYRYYWGCFWNTTIESILYYGRDSGWIAGITNFLSSLCEGQTDPLNLLKVPTLW